MPRLTSDQLAWQRESEVHGPSFPRVGDERPAPRLIALGAVPLSAALCRLAREIGWVPYIVDPRERFAAAGSFPGAQEMIVDWPAAAFAQLGGLDDRTAVAALTHAPELDDPALMLALASEAFYVGALGSRRTQDARRRRLLDAGLTEAQVTRLSGPAGLDLGGDSLGEAALSMLAEAVAVLHGREGARLTTSPNAIRAASRPS
jgi:xanthine dehydrogenase accessory factor